jgi:tetratricopeptide (TPR) repeat protein
MADFRQQNNFQYVNKLCIKSDGRQVPFLAPSRLTHAQEGLIGRDKLVKDLQRQFTAGGNFALSALNGLPGIGKTAIAIEIAHKMIEHFEDGVLWAGLGRSPNLSSQLSLWASALGIPSKEISKLATLEDKLQAIRNRIGLQRILLVVDDAWDVSAALTFRELGGPNCTNLLTTRFPKIASRFAKKTTRVSELSKKDGLKLLRQLAKTVVDAEKTEAEKLVRAVNGLPLALTLMGHYLCEESHSNQPTRIRTALENLKQAEERLRLSEAQPRINYHPSLPADTPISLWAVIEISDKALEHSSRSALRSLSVFLPKPNTFSREAALSVCAPSTESSLDELYDFGLLESSSPDHYQLHQTISEYARLQLNDTLPYMRMADFFASYTQAHKSDFHLLGLEKDNISTALQFAFEQGKQTTFIEGVNAFFRFLVNRGLYEEAKHYLVQAEQAARSLGNKVQIAATLRNFGSLASIEGDYIRAKEYCEEGLSFARDSGDSKTICILLRTLGAIERASGKYISSDKYCLEALPLARQIDDKEELIYVLINLGNNAADIFGRNSQAKSYFQEALKIARRCNNLERISDLLTSLGWLSSHSGDYVRGEELWLESLEISSQIEDLKSQIRLQGTLGWVMGRQGRYPEARDFLQRSLSLACENKFHDEITEWSMNLGVVELHCGNYSLAEKHLQEALILCRQFGTHQQTNIVLENLGLVEIRKGNFKQAEKYLQEGLATARESHYLERISALLTFLGEISIYCGDFTQAEDFLLEGLTLARKIKNGERVSLLVQRLGVLRNANGNSEQAEDFLLEGLTLARQIKYRWLVGSMLNTWGEHHLKQQKLDSASEAFQESLQIGRELESQELIAIALYNLAKVSVIKSNNPKAHCYCEESLSIFRNIGHFRAEEVEEWFISSGIGSE